jgi:hypothetical protein
MIRDHASRRPGLAQAVALLVGMLVPFLIHAAGGAVLTVEAMAQRAEVVAVGKVASLESLRDSTGHPYTRIELSPVEVWKGAGTNRLVLASGTTVLGERWVRVAGEQPYRLGEEVLVFAVRNTVGEAVVLDPVQARFMVHADLKTGERHAENGTLGESESVRAARVRTPAQRRLPLSVLRERVKVAVDQK